MLTGLEGSLTPLSQAGRMSTHAFDTFNEAPDPAGQLSPGTMVDGYQVVEFIASGGMGFIYKARQHTTNRVMALKIMRSHLTTDEVALKRFHREAISVSRLIHRHIVALVGHGRSNSGLMYLAMEWLDGPNLATLLAQFGPMSPVRVARIGVQVAQALALAHGNGIIHRDLKPENVVLVPGDDGSPYQVKVLDFGIAKLQTADAQTQITRLGTVCGTPDFMSPEQARGEDLDGRSDIYALGCMLFTLLTTFVPFPAETPLRVVLRHLTEPFPDLPLETPANLAAIIRRATQKDPLARFSSAEEFAHALETFISTSGLSESDPYFTVDDPGDNAQVFTELAIPSIVAIAAAPTLNMPARIRASADVTGPVNLNMIPTARNDSSASLWQWFFVAAIFTFLFLGGLALILFLL